ncbi:AAA family ATPase [Leeia aquatica]|uniref:Uncharacterized AAA domain-containing protein ycf46 n=1 Tax=Leeia aquatica TaxID=2725557 RepID=A0A847S994_9NEIS|nr:AAA family ATPase [Leeia aquatica]NLR73608.1 AAA family ATPase [Leeia aquatica]
MKQDPERFELLIRAHYPIIVVETHEEARFRDMLELLAAKHDWPLFGWNVADGLARLKFGEPERVLDTYQLTLALGHLYKSPQNGVFLFFDAHPFLDDPVNVRLVKNILQGRQRTDRTLVFISHALSLPPELQRFATSFSLDLPSYDDLYQMMREEAEQWARMHGSKVKAEPAALQQMNRLLVGMTLEDARRLVREAIQNDGAITREDLVRTQQAKNDMLNHDSILSLESDTARFAELGGLSALKDWLALRRPAFFGEVQGLDVPKGILLTGIQGCGKSLAAKCVAGSWGLPLLRLDFGVLYNKFFGETERNLRQALATADAMSPCVLWIDELEKGIHGGDGSFDGGSSRRMLGTLLTWMAERKRPVFLVATANDIDPLPPELVRKGRLDEIFFVDLPGDADRQAIFTIHLQRRQLDEQQFDLAALSQAAEGFSGSEIEQSIVAGLYAAHAQQATLNTAILQTELGRTRPLSVVMAEKLDAMRAWAEDRAVRADGPAVEAV